MAAFGAAASLHGQTRHPEWPARHRQDHAGRTSGGRPPTRPPSRHRPDPKCNGPVGSLRGVKLLARVLAAEIARVHLSGGHDVVVPQLLAQLPFIEVLAGVARATGAELYEILLTATIEDTLGRFRGRREVMRAEGVAHPQEFVEHDAQTIEAIYRELDSIASLRPNTRVIQTTAGGEAAAYEALYSLVMEN